MNTQRALKYADALKAICAEISEQAEDIIAIAPYPNNVVITITLDSVSLPCYTVKKTMMPDIVYKSDLWRDYP